jgi:hypothetical protein
MHIVLKSEEGLLLEDTPPGTVSVTLLLTSVFFTFLLGLLFGVLLLLRYPLNTIDDDHQSGPDAHSGHSHS